MDILTCVLSHGINVIVIQNIAVVIHWWPNGNKSKKHIIFKKHILYSDPYNKLLEFEEDLICDVVCKIDLNLNQFQFFTQKHQQDYFV